MPGKVACDGVGEAELGEASHGKAGEVAHGEAGEATLGEQLAVM